MSYLNRVLKDNPAGLWSFDSASPSSDISAGYFSSGARTINNATIGAGAITTDITPICSGGNNAIKITNAANSTITVPNQYRLFLKRSERKEFSIEFWVQFSTSTQSGYPPSAVYILNAQSNALRLLFQSDRISLVSSKTSQVVSIDAPSYRSQMHIAIVCKDYSITLYVNGVAAKDSLSMPANSYTDTVAGNIVIGPHSTANQYFIVQNLAIYSYALSTDQISNHILWGFANNKPEVFTTNSLGGIVKPYEYDGDIDQIFSYNSEQSWSNGNMSNCIVENGYLTQRSIANAQPFNPSTTASVTYASLGGSSCLTTTGDNSLALNDFQRYFSPTQNIISSQVYYTTNARAGYWTITGFSFGSLVLEKTAVTNEIRLYSPELSSIDLKTTGASGWNNVRVDFLGNTIKLSVGANSVTSSIQDGNISIGNSTLFLGNSYNYSTSGVLTSYPTTASMGLKYFSVFTIGTTRLSSFTNTGDMTLILASDGSVSQYSEWKTLLPIYSTSNIVGSRLYWDSSSSGVSVSSSTDNSSYTAQVSSGDKIPGLNSNANSAPRYIRIVIDNTVGSETIRPKVRFLEAVTYKSLTRYSDGKVFSISPGTTTVNTFQVRPKSYSVLSRGSIGYRFEPITGDVNNTGGQGIVSVPSGDGWRTIEFWFRVDEPSSLATNYIFSVGSSSLSLVYNASNVLTVNGVFTGIWLNGSTFTSGSRTIVPGETYHLLATFSSNRTDSVMLNSAVSSTANSGECSFTDICLYEDQKDQAFAQKKYKMYLGLNSYSTTDSGLSGFTSDSATVFANNWSVIPGAIV